MGQGLGPEEKYLQVMFCSFFTDPKCGAFWTYTAIYNSEFPHWLHLSFSCPCRASHLGRKTEVLQNKGVISLLVNVKQSEGGKRLQDIKVHC